jgi:polyvinyl alcohol dehydrogenase (cytochrome)
VGLKPFPYWGLFALSLATPALSFATQPVIVPSGKAIFNRSCAVCHRPESGTRAPLPAVLHEMTQEAILRALETGAMQAQGAMLTPTEREAVAQYLGKPNAASPKSGNNLCTPRTPWNEKEKPWNGWSPSSDNSRFQPTAAAGLSRLEVPRLRLKWAFGFPNDSAINSQPTVYAGHLFVGSEDGTVYSLSTLSGCTDWTFKALATVRTAPVVDPDGRLVFLGDVNGNVYAVQAESGKLIWRKRVDPHPAAKITGAPILIADHLYVPVSSSEEGWADNLHYPCCTFRGGVTAFEARTGRELWEAHTLPEAPHRTGVNRAGIPTWGPSGGAVWSPPTVDLERHAIYVGTGNSYSGPPSPYTDAVVAFDMRTGRMLWSRQLTPDDLWNGGCVVGKKDNCPPDSGPDYDFGSPPILHSLGNGRRLLIIGQKSGVIHALDPDCQGKIVWQARIGHGGPFGGIEWGGGADQDLAYFPLSDWQPSKPDEGGGLFALRIATGDKVWYAPPPKPACMKLPGCNPALIAPVTIIPGVLFSGSQDGHLRAYGARNGRLLWDFDTLRKFETVNGIAAHGGAFMSIGPVVVNGMLFIEPGYGMIRGNVLLAFSVNGK